MMRICKDCVYSLRPPCKMVEFHGGNLKESENGCKAHRPIYCSGCWTPMYRIGLQYRCKTCEEIIYLDEDGVMVERVKDYS